VARLSGKRLAPTALAALAVVALAIAACGSPSEEDEAGVGRPGPFAAEYEERAGRGETAGVQIAARIGDDRFLSGKFGIECESGRIYAGAMNLRRRLETRIACGRAIGATAEPVFCRLESRAWSAG
jgi:hypothetical protein